MVSVITKDYANIFAINPRLNNPATFIIPGSGWNCFLMFGQIQGIGGCALVAFISAGNTIEVKNMANGTAFTHDLFHFSVNSNVVTISSDMEQSSKLTVITTIPQP